MCLIALAWQAHPHLELVVVANRDELHARATRPAQYREDAPGVLGGRDEVAGGSWLEFATGRRLAAVTNVRRGLAEPRRPRSRGELVSRFAAGAESWPQFTAVCSALAGEFGRFNLLAWDGEQLGYASNADGWQHQPVEPGVHGLSNAGLNTPWPKTLAARACLTGWLQQLPGVPDTTALESLLQGFADRRPADDGELPDTGVGLQLERRLSPMFIVGEDYGTRSTTVVVVARDRRWWFLEQRHATCGIAAGRSLWSGGLAGEAGV